MREFGSYIALGDSFTEGVGDPGSDGKCRGWADRFAQRLAWQRPGLRYANLAIRGKVAGQVLAEQVPAAITMAPDLVSLAVGGNDLLRLSADPDRVAATFEAAVAALTDAGMTVMVFTGFDPRAFPVLRLIRGRAAVYSMHIRAIAVRYDCLLVDLWAMRVLTDRRLWAPDRLHLRPDGHRRVALLAAEVAGLPVAEDWRVPLPPHQAEAGLGGWLASRRGDYSWAREHAAPWAVRRLRGRSAGDNISAKFPELGPVEVPARSWARPAH